MIGIRKIKKGSNELLTPHFKEAEFACRCTHVECNWTIIDLRLVNALEVLRTVVGKPIHVNSGFRCTFHNEQQGGSPGSYHCIGKAADITSEAGIPALHEAALKQRRFADNGGIGLYPHFVHLDVRNYSARWTIK